MIQFNLLPDVKLEYIKSQRTKRLFLTGSFIVTAASVGLLVLLLSVGQLQKKHLSDLNADIKSESAELQGKPDISRILTVQNQLTSLTGLHASKPAVSRIAGYLDKVTPAQVTIASFSADMTGHTFTITGGADAISTINKYVDTLKFTNYTVDGAATPAPAFSSVVLAGFGLASDATKGQKAASYTITLVYDPVILDITKKVDLVVPDKVTTRSELLKPGELFQASTTPTTTTTTTTTKQGSN